MPTRRIFELIVVTGILLYPATGVIKLWARKTLAAKQPGTITHGSAEVLVNIL